MKDVASKADPHFALVAFAQLLLSNTACKFVYSLRTSCICLNPLHMLLFAPTSTNEGTRLALSSLHVSLAFSMSPLDRRAPPCVTRKDAFENTCSPYRPTLYTDVTHAPTLYSSPTGFVRTRSAHTWCGQSGPVCKQCVGVYPPPCSLGEDYLPCRRLVIRTFY